MVLVDGGQESAQGWVGDIASGDVDVHSGFLELALEGVGAGAEGP